MADFTDFRRVVSPNGHESGLDPDSDPDPDRETLSWRIGPADSRLVRALTYLGEGFFGGGLVFMLASLARGSVSAPLERSAWALGVLDRAWPAFERGLDAPVPFDAETVERGRFFRRVNRAIALGFGLLALAAFAGLVWLGSSPVPLLVFVWAFGGFGFLLLKLAA